MQANKAQCKKRVDMEAWHHQPSHRDQIALFRSLICTSASQNPAACGTHQGKQKSQHDPPRRAGVHEITVQSAGCRGGKGIGLVVEAGLLPRHQHVGYQPVIGQDIRSTSPCPSLRIAYRGGTLCTALRRVRTWQR